MSFGAQGAISKDAISKIAGAPRRCPQQGLRDPVVRLIVTHWILGAITGVCCAGFLLLCDIAGLRTLLLQGDDTVVGLALLFGGFAITFGGVVSATAVMIVAPAEETSEPDGGWPADPDEVAIPLLRKSGL